MSAPADKRRRECCRPSEGRREVALRRKAWSCRNLCQSPISGIDQRPGPLDSTPLDKTRAGFAPVDVLKARAKCRRAPPRRRRLALWSQQAPLQGDTSSKQRLSRSVAWRTRGQSRTSDSARTEWPFAHVGTRSPHGDPRGDVTRCECNHRCCGPTASSSHPKSDRRRTLRSDCQSSTRRRIASALAWQPDEANKVPRQDRKERCDFSCRVCALPVLESVERWRTCKILQL